MAKRIRIQDDLYHAVNNAWLNKAKIPDDRPSIGGFVMLDLGVEKTLMADFENFASGKKKPELEEINDAVRLYRKVLGLKRRNEEGIKPALPTLSKIASIKSVEELNALSKELLFDGVDLPFNCDVSEDMGDATKHCFLVLGPSIILPDTTFYDPKNPAGPQFLSVFEAMARKALSFTPLSEEEQDTFIKDALAFDALVAKKVKSQVEWADYVKNHNPMDVEEVAGYLKPFDFKGFLSKVFGENAPKIIVVYDPKAIKEFSSYFNEETLPLYVHWAYVRKLLAASKTLSEELYEISTIYRRTLMGVEKNPEIKKQAYQLASRVFSDPVGVYYGRTYFGEDAKNNVTWMVRKIIDMYKIRIAQNYFLEEKTKEKAILKLSTMAVKMGYPDKVDEFYATMKVDEKDSYFEAMQKIEAAQLQRRIDDLSKPVDRSKWYMPGHMVNACYNPSANDITFPAAILQKPFYSLNQSVSENLGGIGAVIGHEISHAFDNNGAAFDENGNLDNWWSESDYAAFKKLTQDMIEEFDGIPFHGGKVNGELTVSENIADNGGMAVTLAIMHTLADADFKAYFKNWARVWCQKSKEEYIQLLLSNDVHSPTELRANIPPRNFPEWYEAFKVKETDGMYLPKEKRIIIW